MQQVFEQLSSSLTGKMFLPDRMQSHRLPLWWLPYEEHSGEQLIVCPTTVSDAQQIVEFGNEEEYTIVIQTSGHGTIPVQSAKTVLLSPSFYNKEEITVDPVRKTVRIPAGVRWADVNRATLPYSLIALCGSSPYVSPIGSYSFYGGIGVTTRLRGLITDDILELEMVIADGSFIRVTQDCHSDLFWAMCGGGGNFGLVTAMTLKLHPLVPVYKGVIVYPLMDNPEQEAKEILLRYREWSERVPRGLLSLVAIKYRSGSDESNRLDERHIVIDLYWCGKPNMLQNFIDYWTSWKRPERESTSLVDHTPPADPTIPMPSSATMTGGQLFACLSDEVLDIAIHYGITCPVLTNVLIRHIGGAIRDYPDERNAISFRDAQYVMSLYADVPDCLTEGRYKQVADEIDLAVGGYRMGDYLPFLIPKYIPNTYSRAFPGKYQQLCAIKRNYDPTHLFCGGGMLEK